jgi:hypothetical protein
VTEKISIRIVDAGYVLTRFGNNLRHYGFGVKAAAFCGGQNQLYFLTSQASQKLDAIGSEDSA